MRRLLAAVCLPAALGSAATAAPARQFRGVRSVRVFLNGQRLSDAIR